MDFLFVNDGISMLAPPEPENGFTCHTNFHLDNLIREYRGLIRSEKRCIPWFNNALHEFINLCQDVYVETSNYKCAIYQFSSAVVEFPSWE